MKSILKKDFFILKIVALLICMSALFLTNTYPYFKEYGKTEYGAIVKYIIVSILIMAFVCRVWSIFARNIYDNAGIVRSDSSWNLVVAFSVMIAVILLFNLMFGFVYLDELTPAFPSDKLTFSFRYIYELYVGLFFPIVLLVTRKEMEACAGYTSVGSDESSNKNAGKDSDDFNYSFVFALIMAMTMAMMIIFLYYAGGGATFYIVMNSFSVWFILVKNEKNSSFRRKNKLFLISFIIIQVIVHLVAVYLFDRGAFYRMNKLVSVPGDGHYYVPDYYWKQTVIGFVLGISLFVIIKFMNTYKNYKRYGEIYDIVAYLFLIKTVLSVAVDFVPYRFVSCMSPFASYWAFADLMLLVPIIFTGSVDNIKINGIIHMIKECGIGKYYDGVDDTVFMDKNSFSAPGEEYTFIKTRETEYSEASWEYIPPEKKVGKRKKHKQDDSIWDRLKSDRENVFVDEVYNYKGAKYLICHRYKNIEGVKRLQRQWLVLEEISVDDSNMGAGGNKGFSDEADSRVHSVKVNCVRVYDYKVVKKSLKYCRNKYIRFLRDGKYTLGTYKELRHKKFLQKDW